MKQLKSGNSCTWLLLFLNILLILSKQLQCPALAAADLQRGSLTALSKEESPLAGASSPKQILAFDSPAPDTANGAESKAAQADAGKRDSSADLPIRLRPAIRPDEKFDYSHPLTIGDVVKIANGNYPKVLKARIQITSARDAITLQKISEYMPDALWQYQEIMASRNKLTQIIYGSPVFPGNPGPGLDTVSMRPIFFSGGGFNLDWQPLDFGLHKARINLSKANLAQSTQDTRVTELDAQLSAALNFLDAVVAKEQVHAAESNVQAFQQIRSSVNAQVQAKLRATADLYLAEAELARARNSLVRARLSEQIALSNLANALGLAGKNIDINPGGLSAYIERDSAKFREPDLEATPVIAAGRATINAQQAQRKVLDKQYYPAFHWLGGMQLRGSGLGIHAQDQSANVFGFFPCIPNYQVAMIMNWNFLDFARLHQEKKIQDKRISQSHLDLDLVRNNLITEDVQTRAQLQASYEIVENTRVQLEAAEMALKQSQARYNNGLSSVVQLAESSQAMAQARLEVAQAHIGIWKILLSMSALRGDLQPFLLLTHSMEGRH